MSVNNYLFILFDIAFVYIYARLCELNRVANTNFKMIAQIL